MVIVDSSAWIQAFRFSDSPERLEVDRLLDSEEIVMVGPVLAEVLQGARSPQEFARLAAQLTPLPYLSETQGTWRSVGELSFRLRSGGTPLALVDLLIAALAMEHDCAVYTQDEHFQRVPGLWLHEAKVG